ncbi:unnamed protein product [Rotaria sp. Silwood2]|nr:unnamed protein product [Rotaria sp. Silwood2]CAF4090462.1 unnamed protein product [Rotaria sp. Silwood2]
MELIALLAPYITTLRTQCTKCHILSQYITVADIAHLLVLSKQNKLALAIDLNVYSNNQQFRMFDSVKKNKNNALLQTIYYPFNNQPNTSYDEIFSKSIITNVQQIDAPIIFFEKNLFRLLSYSGFSTSACFENLSRKLNDINSHSNVYSAAGINSQRILNLKQFHVNQASEQEKLYQYDKDIENFISFVKNIITLDPLHQGYISSCVRGQYNKNIFCFNIGGQYRFCSRKGSHHLRNTTAILVDIKNKIYSIRCKDPECNNTVLTWMQIN